LGRIEFFFREEGEWLPGVLDVLLQHGTHGGSEASVTSASGADGSRCASRVADDKLALHSLKALSSSGVQVMGWEPLTLGPENVVQCCLGGRSVGQKSPVEIQHAQKSTELTGGLWRVAVLETRHSLFQRFRNFGRHLVTQEGDLGCSEDASRRVDNDPVPLELGEESS
jgi:hypothetical protein